MKSRAWTPCEASSGTSWPLLLSLPAFQVPPCCCPPCCQVGACVEGAWERKWCFSIESQHFMYNFLCAPFLCPKSYQASIFSAGTWCFTCLPRTLCLLFIFITGFRWSFGGKHIALLTRHILLFMTPYDALRFPQRWSRASAPYGWSAGLWLLKDSLNKTEQQARSAPCWFVADKQTALPWAWEICFYSFIWVCYCQGGSSGASDEALLRQPLVNK